MYLIRQIGASLGIVALALLGSTHNSSALDRADRRPQELRFAWPVDARAHVTERITKEGMTADFSYTISLSERLDSTSLQLDYQDFDVVRVNGEDAHSPAMRKVLEPGLPMLTSYPSLYISRTGEFEATGGFDAMMRKALDYIGSRSGKKMDEEQKAAFEKLMTSPDMTAAITQKFGEAWMVWVEMWIGEVPPKGGKLKYMTKVPIGRKAVEAPLFKEFIESEDRSTGSIRLATESVLEGAEATAALRDYIDSLMEQTKTTAKFFSKDSVANFRRVTRFSVETDPMTLEPKFARSEQTVSITMGDGETKDQKETHEYFFDWVHRRQASPSSNTTDKADPKRHID